MVHSSTQFPLSFRISKFPIDDVLALTETAVESAQGCEIAADYRKEWGDEGEPVDNCLWRQLVN